MKILFSLLLLFLASCTGYSIVEIEKEGPFIVQRVIDGDTLVLNTTEHVRLSGINAPEKGECYYKEAKDKLSELTLGKEIYLEKDISNKDKYGRLLRYVYINEVFVNELLVEEGFVKVYDKYENDTKKYSALKLEEDGAKEKFDGVWSCYNLLENCLYVGSKNSKLYHDPDCKYAKRIKAENRICYKSEEEVKGLNKSKC